MYKNKELIIKDHLSNMQVNLIFAGYVHCNSSWNYFNFKPECSKFYYICDGEGCIKVGNQEFYPKPGELLLLPAGTMQSISTISNNTFKKYFCHFTASIGELNLFDIIKTPITLNVKEKDYVENSFKQIVIAYGKNDIASSLKIKSLLFDIFAYFFSYSEISEIHLSSSLLANRLHDIAEYIKNNLHRNISINELAETVDLHPNYFIRFFKNHMGCSPKKYIQKTKLEKAKILLGTTNLNISEITDSVGFSDVFYFSKAFKNYSGFCPTDFRDFESMNNKAQLNLSHTTEQKRASGN